MTTVRNDKITAVDLSLVELVNNPMNKNVKSHFTKEELAYQEARKNRKIRKLDFEVR